MLIEAYKKELGKEETLFYKEKEIQTCMLYFR